MLDCDFQFGNPILAGLVRLDLQAPAAAKAVALAPWWSAHPRLSLDVPLLGVWSALEGLVPHHRDS